MGVNNISDLIGNLNSSPEYNDFHADNTIVMGELIEKGYDWGRNKWYQKWTSTNEHRQRINKKIEDHFYYREIGTTPISRWSHFMVRNLNEIMPKYELVYTLWDRDLDKLLIWRDDLTIAIKRHDEAGNTVKDTNTTEDTTIDSTEGIDYINDETSNTDTTSVNEEQNLHADLNIGVKDVNDTLSGSDNTTIDTSEMFTENTDKHSKDREIDSKYPQAMLNGSADYGSNGSDKETAYEDEHTSETIGTSDSATNYGKVDDVHTDTSDTNLGGYVTNDDGLETTESVKNQNSSKDTLANTDKNTLISDIMNMIETLSYTDKEVSTKYGNMLEKWLIIIKEYEDTDKLILNELEKCFSAIITHTPNGGW